MPEHSVKSAAYRHFFSRPTPPCINFLLLVTDPTAGKNGPERVAPHELVKAGSLHGAASQSQRHNEREPTNVSLRAATSPADFPSERLSHYPRVLPRARPGMRRWGWQWLRAEHTMCAGGHGTSLREDP